MLVPLLFGFTSLVSGENCPAAVDVEARVRVILHLTPEQELSEGFIVERHEAGLYVELRSADSTLIGQRTLPPEGSCDELAQAAAVVLSAWLSDVHPDFAGELPERAPEPVPEPEPEKKEPPPPSPQPQPEIKAPPPPPPPPPSPASPHHWDFGAGLGADLTDAQVTLGGVLTAGFVADANGFGVTAIALPTLPRREPLGDGHFTWRRWPLAIGPTFRASTESWGWDFSAGPALSWLHLAGTDFDHNFPENGPAWCAFFNVRVSTRGGRWGLFGLASAQYYFEDSTVYATGVTPEYVLPRYGLGLFVGARLDP